MTDRGYYSLIQFVPNPSREEGANVGVVLVCPKLESFAVRMAENNEAVKRMFTASAFDDARLNIAKGAMASRIRSDLGREPTLEKLRWFRSIESNRLLLTEPRPIAVEGDTENLAESLYLEMVHWAEKHRNRASAPSAAWLVDYLEKENVPITKPGTVQIPILEESVPVAFSYVNGARHFVHPQGFSATKEAALGKAKDVGAQGRLLHLHSKHEHPSSKLVVFAKFSNKEHSQTIKNVLEEMDVRLVSEDEQVLFATEVKNSAH